MRRFIRQASLVAAGILAVLSVLDIVYTWSISENPVYGIGRDERVDWVIAGDSRSVGLGGQYLSTITGKKVVNISSPYYTLENNREILQYFFDNGNRAERVLLQMDQKFGSRRRVLMRDYEYMPHVIRQKGLFSPRFPFKYYAENNKNIRPGQVMEFARKALSGEAKAADEDTGYTKATSFIRNPRLMVDHSKDEFRLDDIKALRDYLHTKGVKELVLYLPPYLPEWIQTQSDSSSFKQKLRDAGFRYYDFSNVYGDTTYFKDHLHLHNRKYNEFSRLMAATVIQGE